MKLRLSIALGFLPLLCASDWPEIEAVDREFRISQPNGVRIEVSILSSSGAAAYELRCRDGDQEDDDFTYSGLLQCRLMDASRASPDPDLLSQPGATRDWLSRGRFLYEELTGNCRNDPVWGARRQFALRNMRLAITIADLHASEDAVDERRVSYALRIEAHPDPTASNRDDERVLVPSGEDTVDCTKKREWWVQTR